MIDAQRLDYYHQLERERIHLLLIDEAGKGLDDVAAGKVKDARSAITAIKRPSGVTESLGSRKSTPASISKANDCQFCASRDAITRMTPLVPSLPGT